LRVAIELLGIRLLRAGIELPLIMEMQAVLLKRLELLRF